MCGWCVFLLALSSYSTPSDYSLREWNYQSLRGELWCWKLLFSLPPHTIFLYQIYTFFSVWNFFQIIRCRKKSRKFVFVLCGWWWLLRFYQSVSVPDRTRGRRETSACLLLWKIEKNLYFFLLCSACCCCGGQHNIILTHFSRKKKFFSSPKLFFPHEFFSPFSILLNVLTVATRKIKTQQQWEINKKFFLCVIWDNYKQGTADSGL